MTLRTMSDAESNGSHADTGDITGLAHVNIPGEIDLSHGVILYLDDVSVSFDGFRALNKLSLSMDSDELRCIIGPNGAGKTTMMDVITGKTKPDQGRVFLGRASRHRAKISKTDRVRTTHCLGESRSGDA